MLALEALSEQRDAQSSSSNGGVAHGPAWYRRRIRLWGPLLACVLPAVLGGAALLIRELFEGRARGWTSIVLGVAAAPGLLGVGVPFATTSEYPIGIAGSALLWLVVGFAAARVATRNPVATFHDFWRANWWLTGAVFLGAVLGLVGAGALGTQLQL